MRTNLPKWIIVHHSAVSREIQPNQFLPINNYHKQKWSFKSELSLYGGYTYLIEPNGELKQYRAETEEQAHTVGMNTKSLGICVVGNFNIELPTVVQEETLTKLLLELMKKWDIPVERITPHRRWSATDCFGLRLKDDFAMRLVMRELQKSNGEQEVKLLKKQITIIRKMIEVYTKLLILIRSIRDKKED